MDNVDGPKVLTGLYGNGPELLPRGASLNQDVAVLSVATWLSAQ